MSITIGRRSLIAGGLAIPLLALPGCATLGDFGLEPAIRRLLTLSSQRAFANLLEDNGFFESEVARLDLPPQLGGSGVAAALAGLLGTSGVQTQLLRIVNQAASSAARTAAPIVYDSIRNMSIVDAAAIVRGGPTAATDYLQASIGTAIVEAMIPGMGNALRVLDNGLVTRALQATTGIDFPSLQRNLTQQAANGIWRAIGREEAAIRADPSSANDPVLASVFGLLR